MGDSGSERAGGEGGWREPGATVIVFVCLWFVLDRTASHLGSMRGEYGLVVCAVVIAAAVAGEGLLSRRRPGAALLALGLGRPRMATLGTSVLFSALLLAFYPVFALVTGTPVALRPDAGWLALGMLAQGGIAEEVVFRGFLFRRFRQGRTFWRAAALSAVPFSAVHLLLFLTLDFELALASFLLAVSMSFPLAWLFETSRGTIWASALLHAVVQASIKLVETDDQAFALLAVGWIAIAALVPWTLFLLVRPRAGGL